MAKPDVVKMVSRRDFVLRTTLGHSVAFKKNEVTLVPRIISDKALEVGVEFADEAEKDTANKLLEEVPKVQLSETDRTKKLFDAIVDICAKNDPEDFTASGKPSVKAIERLTGLQTSVKEVNTLWDKYNHDKAEGLLEGN